MCYSEIEIKNEKIGYDMKKIIIILISIIGFYSNISSIRRSHGGNQLHELAYNCYRVRVKMPLEDLYDYNNTNPSETDDTLRTVGEIAQEQYEKTRDSYCASMAEEFRKY